MVLIRINNSVIFNDMKISKGTVVYTFYDEKVVL